MKIFLGLISFLISTQCIFADSESFYVLTNSGPLNLRDKPETGKVIEKIPKGEKVTTISPGKEEIPYTWAKVKTEKNKIGYVSREFLSKLSTDVLDKVEFFGIFRNPETGSKEFSIQPTAYIRNSEWIGAGNGDAETNYLLNSAIKKKTGFAILDRAGNFLKSVNLGKLGKSGCQEYAIGIGELSAEEKALYSEEVKFAVNDKKGIRPIGIEDKFSDSLIDPLKKQVEKELKKNKIDSNIIGQIKFEKGFFINDGDGKKYALARFVYRKEEMEHLNSFIIAQVSGEKLEKVISVNHQELSSDLAPYGGQFHFLGGFHKGKDLILIFHHNGFDGYIRGIFKIESGKWKELTNGGGDAC